MSIQEFYSKGFFEGRRLEQRNQIQKITFPAFMNVDTAPAEIEKAFENIYDETEKENYNGRND